MILKLRKQALLIGFLAIVLLILLVGIFFPQKNAAGNLVQAQISSTNPSGNPPPIGLNPGNLAPSFSLVTPERLKISREFFAGKPLLIFFTTTYCVPCQIGADNLARFDEEKGENALHVLVVFVDPNEKPAQLLAWKKQFGRPDWFVAHENGMASAYEVRYLDTKFLLDKEGIVFWKNIEPLTYEMAQQILSPLLEKF